MNTINKLKNVLGIDIGRVIIGAADDDGSADTSFLSGGEDRAMQTPATPDAYEVIAELVERFSGAVWLVSKCGPRIQARTRHWLTHHRFFERTGIAPTHLRFCLQRHQKLNHCLEIGATHFIDDRLDVLRHLRGHVSNLYLFGAQRQPERPEWVTFVRDWRAVNATLADLS